MQGQNHSQNLGRAVLSTNPSGTVAESAPSSQEVNKEASHKASSCLLAVAMSGDDELRLSSGGPAIGMSLFPFPHHLPPCGNCFSGFLGRRMVSSVTAAPCFPMDHLGLQPQIYPRRHLPSMYCTCTVPWKGPSPSPQSSHKIATRRH